MAMTQRTGKGQADRQMSVTVIPLDQLPRLLTHFFYSSKTKALWERKNCVSGINIRLRLKNWFQLGSFAKRIPVLFWQNHRRPQLESGPNDYEWKTIWLVPLLSLTEVHKQPDWSQYLELFGLILHSRLTTSLDRIRNVHQNLRHHYVQKKSTHCTVK